MPDAAQSPQEQPCSDGYALSSAATVVATTFAITVEADVLRKTHTDVQRCRPPQRARQKSVILKAYRLGLPTMARQFFLLPAARGALLRLIAVPINEAAVLSANARTHSCGGRARLVKAPEQWEGQRGAGYQRERRAKINRRSAVAGVRVRVSDAAEVVLCPPSS